MTNDGDDGNGLQQGELRKRVTRFVKFVSDYVKILGSTILILM